MVSCEFNSSGKEYYSPCVCLPCSKHSNKCFPCLLSVISWKSHQKSASTFLDKQVTFKETNIRQPKSFTTKLQIRILTSAKLGSLNIHDIEKFQAFTIAFGPLGNLHTYLGHEGYLALFLGWRVNFWTRSLKACIQRECLSCSLCHNGLWLGFSFARSLPPQEDQFLFFFTQDLPTGPLLLLPAGYDSIHSRVCCSE